MNGNEPCYPHEDQDSCGNPIERHAGLTKRELFAAMAMQGMLSQVGGAMRKYMGYRS